MLKGYCMQINDRNSKNQNATYLEKCEAFFSRMVPNDFSFNTLIDAYLRFENLDQALQRFEEMKKRNIQPDNVTFSTIIKGIKNVHSTQRKERRVMNIKTRMTLSNSNISLQKVLELFSQAKQNAEMFPDEILYNCVLDACIEFGSFNKAKEIYKEMIDSGVEPSKYTFGILLKGYGLARDFEGVMDIYGKMKSKDIKINEITYSNLIEACLKCDKFEQAKTFFKDMKQDPFLKPNAKVYGALIKGACALRQFDFAYELFTEMDRNLSIIPNIQTYNAVLDCAFKTDSNKIFDIYERIMQRSGLDFQPDLNTYSTQIKALCKANKINEAFKIYELVQAEKKLQMNDDVLYNSLIHGLYKAKKCEEALSVYEDMKKNGVQPSAHTASNLIKLYNSQFKIDKALEVFRDVRIKSIPGVILYTNIIQGCVKCKKISEMLDLVADMKRNDIQCDSILYNTIISGLAYNFHLKDAIDFLLEAFNKRILLNMDVYITVLKNIYRKMNCRYEMKSDLTQDEYEELLNQILKKLEELKINIDPEVMEQIQFSGLNDLDSGSRRRTEQISLRRSSNKETIITRRTIF